MQQTLRQGNLLVVQPTAGQVGVLHVMSMPANPSHTGQRNRSTEFLRTVARPSQRVKLTAFATPVETAAEVALFNQLYPQHSTNFERFSNLYNSYAADGAVGSSQKNDDSIGYKSPQLLKQYEL